MTEQTTGHTKGPWKAVPNDRNESHGIRGSNNEDIADTGIWHREHRDEMLANARLIAAAPELLEALEGLAEESQGSVELDSWPELQDAIRKAYEAIEKAKGEERES